MNAESHIPAPFVVGVGRSGTTMLRLMLDAHSELTIPPETHFLPDLIETFESVPVTPEMVFERLTEDRRWEDFHLDAEALRARLEAVEPFDIEPVLRTFYELYAEKEGKPRWGDKTPNYVDKMGEIEAVLPEARFIHLIRDGRDVAMSRIKRSLKNPPPMARVARNWKRRIRRAQRQGSKLNHYLELRYEDLILETEATLRTICEFIELPFEERDAHLLRARRGADVGDGARPEAGRRQAAPAGRGAHAGSRADPGAAVRGCDRALAQADGLRRPRDVRAGRRRPARRARLRGDGPEPQAEQAQVGARRTGRARPPGDRADRRPARRRPAAAEAIDPDTTRPPAPFVVGVTRSGTTLLRMMLDSHPQLAIPPESHFVPDLIEYFQEAKEPTVDEALEQIEGNRRWGDFHLDAGGAA